LCQIFEKQVTKMLKLKSSSLVSGVLHGPSNKSSNQIGSYRTPSTSISQTFPPNPSSKLKNKKTKKIIEIFIFQNYQKKNATLGQLFTKFYFIFGII
jgi:hypothetical protein